MYEIINDKDKFKELETDPTLKREGQLQRFLLNLKGFLIKMNIRKNIQLDQ